MRFISHKCFLVNASDKLLAFALAFSLTYTFVLAVSTYICTYDNGLLKVAIMFKSFTVTFIFEASEFTAFQLTF